ncbi:hypothetical protein A2U01_0105647, partial [Trifolium medium]|nr:hypothetical protein [Trifolium medium]
RHVTKSVFIAAWIKDIHDATVVEVDDGENRGGNGKIGGHKSTVSHTVQSIEIVSFRAGELVWWK